MRVVRVVSVVRFVRLGHSLAPVSRLGVMDIASMIMGASIISIAWIAFWPWAQLKRLRELKGRAAAGPDPDSTPSS